MTFDVDAKVRSCAQILKDNLLLGKLSGGDMIAIEAKYHPACLLDLYRKAARSLTTPCETENVNCITGLDADSIALAEIIAYLEEARANDILPPVFKLTELSQLYAEQLQRHGMCLTNRPNATRFKDRLLENFPDVTAVSHGRDVLLTFRENLGIALEKIKQNSDTDAVHLMHTAKLIRNEMFSSEFTFSGSFDSKSQEKSVPQVLLTLVNMLLEGPGNFESVTNQAALSISQLIIFNAVKRPRKTSVADVHHQAPISRHPLSQETPMPIYLGLMLHATTRKKTLVDKCFKLGLSISYSRVLQISNEVANSICNQYNANQLVCPPSLYRGVFTVAAEDNIDHNLSSNTARSSFHGTAISLIQLPSSDLNCVGRIFESVNLQNAPDDNSGIVLPNSYTQVLPCFLPTTDPVVPQVQFSLSEPCDVVASEYDWLDKITDCVENNIEPVNVTWAGYHADVSIQAKQPLPVFAMLPLFKHAAHEAAMIRHCLAVVEVATKHLNPKQCPVITFDQPLYALAKQIQWHWPKSFGEDRFVVMMGGLHIEMASLRMLGHWLEGSGWIQCLVQGEVATAGVADNFIHASHVKRTRYAHTVTAASLYISLKRAYKSFCEEVSDGEQMPFDDWRKQRESSSVQFKYWNTVLEVELLVLTFVRSLREANFDLYVHSLQKLAPWFFALDQTNYARWISVHVRDMLCIADTHPDIASEFAAGKFTVSKSNRKFSSISIDQAHEQLNAMIKGDGGAIGITENEATLSRWIIAEPEIMRILHEFDDNQYSSSINTEHHEQKPACQKRFKEDVMKLLQVFEDNNPFGQTIADDLMSLDSHVLADIAVHKSIKTVHAIGTLQFQKFLKDRLQGSISVLTPLPRNKLPLFCFKPLSKKQDFKSLKVKELKTDCELFSRLYIACQSRNGDLDEFFRHENQCYPPSISDRGKLRFGTKSDLLACLKSVSESNQDIASLQIDAYVLDGAVIVQMLRPGVSKTFEEYAEKLFVPYIQSFLNSVQRLDIVFDVYLSNSLKFTTREKRGTGTRTRVAANTKIPKKWTEFLRVDDNKTELFHFLADVLTTVNIPAKLIFVTYDGHVRCCSAPADIGGIDPCSHEEADTCMILHCQHAAQTGSRKIAIRTVDTDVVILAIAYFHNLQIDELWVHFGMGKSSRLIAAHDLSNSFGPAKCKALPVFHCFTGCDTVSSFASKGKKTAWEAWSSYPVVTEAFLNLCEVTDDIDEATISVLERFVIIMYDRTSDCTDLNAARKQLFTKKSRTLESLPPTSDAFIQHVKRTILQGVHCWGHCLNKQPQLYNPGQWGWTKDGNSWTPLWGMLPEASKICNELIHCACKKGCTNRKCKCIKNHLPCTALCECDGECRPT